MAGTSKSEPPCGREHDFEVLSKSRKGSILVLLLYLLLELLGSPIVENIVLKGAWILLTFYMDFYPILHPQKDPQIM